MKCYSIFNHFYSSCGGCFAITEIKTFRTFQNHEVFIQNLSILNKVLYTENLLYKSTVSETMSRLTDFVRVVLLKADASIRVQHRLICELKVKRVEIDLSLKTLLFV